MSNIKNMNNIKNIGFIIIWPQHRDFKKNLVYELNENNYIMVQKFIPKINLGDKRIIMINGKTGSYSLARITKKGEHLGNIAAGGYPLVKKLTKNNPTMKKKFDDLNNFEDQVA